MTEKCPKKKEVLRSKAPAAFYKQTSSPLHCEAWENWTPRDSDVTTGRNQAANAAANWLRKPGRISRHCQKKKKDVEVDTEYGTILPYGISILITGSLLTGLWSVVTRVFTRLFTSIKFEWVMYGFDLLITGTPWQYGSTSIYWQIGDLYELSCFIVQWMDYFNVDGNSPKLHVQSSYALTLTQSVSQLRNDQCSL